MKMDKVAGSGYDEYYTPKYAVEPLLKYIPKGSSIWCPFDTEDSLIVKLLVEHGCAVTNTHINTGYDFFKVIPPQSDFIISNPPYSKKTEVLQRLFEIGTPFAMLLGVVGLFESQVRFNMFKNNPHEVMYMSKRISYFTSYEQQKPAANPPFSSVWLCSKVLPTQLVYEEVKNNGKI